MVTHLREKTTIVGKTFKDGYNKIKYDIPSTKRDKKTNGLKKFKIKDEDILDDRAPFEREEYSSEEDDRV